MDFNEINWLSDYFEDQITYSTSEIESIRNFVLIWNIFESVAGNRSMSIREIDRLVGRLANRNMLQLHDFQEFIEYARQAYDFEREAIEFLNLRRNGQEVERLVIAFLDGRERRLPQMVRALLYITYRMRNNLMHGEKNILTIDTQNADFNLVNKLLAKILDLHKEYSNLQIRIR